MSKLAIRPATETDLEAIVQIGQSLSSGPPDAMARHHLLALLQRADHAVLVAGSPEGTIVGWIHVFVSTRVMSGSFAEVGGLVVAPERRREGVGCALVRAAEVWAREQGLHRLRVRVNTRREGAHRFYQRLRYDVAKEQLIYERGL